MRGEPDRSGSIQLDPSGSIELAPGKSIPEWLVLSVVLVGQFMVVLDASIVNVALPSIQRDLHFSTTGLQWIVNAYTLTFAGFLLLGGACRGPLRPAPDLPPRPRLCSPPRACWAAWPRTRRG